MSEKLSLSFGAGGVQAEGTVAVVGLLIIIALCLALRFFRGWNTKR